MSSDPRKDDIVKGGLDNSEELFTRVKSNWLRYEVMLSDSKVNYYFCASFVIVVLAVLIKLPALVTSAEFYAETATIFFKEANEASFWEILTYTWADYLVTFQLLVSFILVRVFGVIEYFPGTVNFIFLLFVAFSVSLINLRAFRVLIASDFLRFIIGLSIGLTPNFELYELLHSNLFGFTIFLLFIFVDKDQFNRRLFYFLTLLLFLVGISRPNMVAFLPVYIVLLGIALKAHHVRDIIFYGAGTVSLSLQAYVVIMAQLYWSVRRDTGIYNEISGIGSLFAPLEATINQYYNALLGIIFNEVIGFYPFVALVIIITALILLACYYMYRRRRFLILYYFGLSQILAFGQLYFVTFSSPVPPDWSMISYDMMRWWIYSDYVIYISVMVLAYNTVQEILFRVPVIALRDVSHRVAVLVLSLLPILLHIYPFYRYVGPYIGHDSLSNWENYRYLLEEDDYYIPTNPVQNFQWGIWQDNGMLTIDVRAEGTVNSVQLSETVGDLKVRSILIINHDYFNSMKDLIIKAYDKEGREIAIPRRLNDFEDRYLYYYFTERVRPYSLIFFNEKIERVYIRPDLHLFGKIDTVERILISGKDE